SDTEGEEAIFWKPQLGDENGEEGDDNESQQQDADGSNRESSIYSECSTERSQDLSDMELPTTPDLYDSDDLGVVDAPDGLIDQDDDLDESSNEDESSEEDEATDAAVDVDNGEKPLRSQKR
ncbi:hypothetical protein BGX21_005817, partial [Mortierella sp. AD011]